MCAIIGDELQMELSRCAASSVEREDSRHYARRIPRARLGSLVPTRASYTWTKQVIEMVEHDGWHVTSGAPGPGCGHRHSSSPLFT